MSFFSETPVLFYKMEEAYNKNSGLLEWIFIPHFLKDTPKEELERLNKTWSRGD